MVKTDILVVGAGIVGTATALELAGRHDVQVVDAGALDDVIQVTRWDGAGEPTFEWRPRRPVPAQSEAFETTWRRYRENKNIG